MLNSLPKTWWKRSDRMIRWPKKAIFDRFLSLFKYPRMQDWLFFQPKKRRFNMVGEGCPDQKKSWPISTYFHPHSKKINFHVAIHPAVRDLEKSRVYKRKKRKKWLKTAKKNPLFFCTDFSCIHTYFAFWPLPCLSRAASTSPRLNLAKQNHIANTLTSRQCGRHISPTRIIKPTNLSEIHSTI